MVEVPVWAAAGLKKSDDLQTKVRALLAERWQRIGYEAQLQAARIRSRPLQTQGRHISLRAFYADLRKNN